MIVSHGYFDGVLTVVYQLPVTPDDRVLVMGLVGTKLKEMPVTLKELTVRWVQQR